MKQCNNCKIQKELTEFSPNKSGKFGVAGSCKICRRVITKACKARNKEKYQIQHRDYYRANPAKRLFAAAKNRAKELALPFDITEEDVVIPELCPILQIPLMVNMGVAKDNSPSIDRISPNLGYVKNNVIITSYRANRIKNDATIDELKKISDFYCNLPKL